MEDLRVKQVNKFTSKIVDKQISRHPLKSLVILIYNETEYDIYRDATPVESERINKLAIVEKDKDFFYVQEWIGDEVVFLDDEEKSPWLITMTITGLPRVPKQDDCLIIEGRKHTITKVKPINKSIQSVITILTYPERTDEIDEFSIKGVKLYSNHTLITTPENHLDEEVILEFKYGGTPTHYKVNTEDWKPFYYKFKTKLLLGMTVTLKNAESELTPYNVIQ